MNTKQEGTKVPQVTPSESTASASSPIGARSILPWILTALLLAGASYVFTTRGSLGSIAPTQPATLSKLPESYGLCGESGKVYTVDKDKPNVDCILVRKDDILATGTKGNVKFRAIITH
jgi:hypothetical protein